jgi:hypothetical protein
LSYVAEPAQGVWLIAMDSCSYDRNEIEGKPETAGRFSPQTLDWVLRMTRLGKARGKQVIGMMHHGLIEHYAGQSMLFPEYVVEDSDSVSRQLAQAGLEVVFTGHYHANDAALRETGGGSFLFDIETGSLVTWPCPLRIVTVKPNRKLDVDTRFIEDIDYDTGGAPFPDYARQYLELGLTGIASYMLATEYFLPPEDPQTGVYASQLAQAFMAHYAGGERPTPDILSLIGGYLSQPPDTFQYLLGRYLGALWTDLPPADTALTIDLKTGDVSEGSPD